MKGVAGALLALVTVTAPSHAQSPSRSSPRTELIMLTGSESGVYHPIGRDIKRLLDEVGSELQIELAVVPSQGALQNVVEVFRHRSIQLGFTQGDVLAYLEIYARGDPDARRILGGLQVVGHLFEEDVYLFARSGTREIGDLAGKRIGVGPAGSGTTVTALALLHLAGVEPRELVNLDLGEALTALDRGRLDAVFHVIGTPSENLQQSVPPSGRIVLLPVRPPEHSSLARYYAPSTIRARAYPWLDQPVDTVKVRSVMVTAGAHAESPACDAIGRLTKLVLTNLDWLRRHGHAKWKDIQLSRDALLTDPRISPCVAEALRQ